MTNVFFVILCRQTRANLPFSFMREMVLGDISELGINVVRVHHGASLKPVRVSLDTKASTGSYYVFVMRAI